MKSIINYIVEKLKINSQSKINQNNFTDEELRNDYDEVENAMTKVEKQAFAQKYGIQSNKYRDIQLVILDRLRENRQDKKKFDKDDITDFNRFDIKDKEYIDYLDQEPIEFVETLFEYYEDQAKKRNLLKWANVVNQRNIGYRISFADKYLLKKYNTLKTYLENAK